MLLYGDSRRHYRTHQASQEFLQRIKDGEHPALVAEEMKQPWSEGIIEAILDPLWLVDIFYKPVQGAKWLEKISVSLSKPLQKFAKILVCGEDSQTVEFLKNTLSNESCFIQHYNWSA